MTIRHQIIDRLINKIKARVIKKQNIEVNVIYFV